MNGEDDVAPEGLRNVKIDGEWQRVAVNGVSGEVLIVLVEAELSGEGRE